MRFEYGWYEIDIGIGIYKQTSSASMIFDSLHNYVFGVDDIEKKIQFGHPYAPYCIVSFYIIFCKWIGPALMVDRKPFELKNVLIFYNFFQMIVNTYLTIKAVEGLLRMWNVRCEEYTTSPEMAVVVKDFDLALWHLYLIKYIDLFDAVFFVLRKKEKQITFLHLFHHAVLCLICYIYLESLDIAFYLIVALAINIFIHVIMYLYYFLSAFGPHMQKYLWWKRYLTTLQMIQFGIILMYMAVSFGTGCHKTGPMEISFFCFIAALLALFTNFYTKSFVNK
ncbi:hypothetical protein JTE90_005105 [Oedothorax gibbosus]|uniref:Elongation of very long chain fatty acids protein n=1 Tax=Oedothorax gibbosus TaxID=931172 RepID=A0AAV6VCR4_9ARAC|nr:hypothetical protein JTE90_005105 [Oedothorax gibbosus]